MTGRPFPGTVRYHNPELEIVTEVRAVVSNRIARREAVAMLVGKDLPRRDLEAAHTYWLGQMPRFDWDDHTGTHVLMILEDALRETPRGE